MIHYHDQNSNLEFEINRNARDIIYHIYTEYNSGISLGFSRNRNNNIYNITHLYTVELGYIVKTQFY